MHSMTPIVSYAQTHGVKKDLLNTRMLWCNRLKKLTADSQIDKGLPKKRNSLTGAGDK